ncbi:hypothetical protein Fcan01_25469 [Folsomia candida]|uniref:Uncharacterized protein n=1 Tax=Folsomia candida TaxID=158441 RepID=A0A226D3T3_FOLCA|nr:hypothetical protein Fcan01_25469 [Folsomia candida]
MGIGILETLTWLGVIDCILAGVFSTLIYPRIAVEMWLQVLQRNINEASMKQYRVAESLQNLFHDVARFPVMSLVLGGVVMAEVLSLYILITSWKPIPITVAVFFTLVAFDFSVVINYILNDLSRYFVASVGYIETVKRSAKGTKWSNGFLKSCPPLKFPVGDGTFFDKMSSLNIWQTCINHLVTLLLM